jgi:iron complex outermembrane recepter protein
MLRSRFTRPALLLWGAYAAFWGHWASAADTPAAATRASDSELQELVVTGSRLITNGNESPTPLTVVDTATLDTLTPSNIPDALNKLPQFTGSSSAQTSNNASSNAAGNFLSLRGLGPDRTLILLDGHRVPAVGQSNAVDTNILPQMLMQRVDVVTGGASAVYGSDAIAGVVNFVLDKRFAGVKVEAQDGVSGHDDDKSWRSGIAGGVALADGRLHLEGSYEHYNSDGLLDDARESGRMVYTAQGAGTLANPFTLVPNSRWTIAPFGGVILSGPLAGQEFATNGVLTPFAHGSPTANPIIESGGDGGFFNDSALASVRTDQLFGRAEFEISDKISAYLQAYGSEATNESTFAPFYCLTCSIPSTNAFLPASAQSALANAGVPGFAFGSFDANAPPLQILGRTTTAVATLGLDGNLGENYDWNFYYTHGDSRQTVYNEGNINTARELAALDAVSSNGQIVCRVTITNPGLYPGCIPLNVFGPTAANPAAVAYVRGDTQYTAKNTPDDLGASIRGPMFDDWAGTVRSALSFEYQKLRLDTVSNAQPTDRVDCTGIEYACGPNTATWISNVVASGGGSESIKEVAAEFDVPLLKDKPFARSVDLNAAVRYADYSASGGATTWKIGLDWALSDDIRFRSTRSRDLRAPNLNDLYAPQNASPTGYTDEHTHTGGIVTVISQGNPNLLPEVANTFTVGIVVSPRGLPGLNASLDYFNIKMDNAITAVDPRSNSVQNECEASNGTSPLCSLMIRPLPYSDTSPANFPTAILSEELNVATLKTHGFDLEVGYHFDLAGGQLAMRLLGTYQPKFDTQTIPGAVVVDAAGAASQPATKLNAFINYTRGGASIDLLERWRSSEKQSGDPTLVFDIPAIPSVAYTDMTLGYEFGVKRSTAKVYLSVQNLFDKSPPIYANQAVASTPGFGFPATIGDDIVGRYFTLGVRLKL